MRKVPIRIIIADDIESHRRRIARIVAEQPDMTVVATAARGTDVVRWVQELNPDVILLDIEMESRYAGIEAARRIHEFNPDIRIVILTIHDDDTAVVAAFQIGVTDYLLKTADNGTIAEAIRTAFSNQPPMRPLIAEKLRKELERSHNELHQSRAMEERLFYTLRLISDLTPTEIGILRLLYDGKKRREIAEERFVSLGTVKTQINSILKKCHFQESRELVALLKKYCVFELIDRLSQ
jgi:DNA-binding NarL/FixJ family response regulator